jgi:hypothetical protein
LGGLLRVALLVQTLYACASGTDVGGLLYVSTTWVAQAGAKHMPVVKKTPDSWYNFNRISLAAGKHYRPVLRTCAVVSANSWPMVPLAHHEINNKHDCTARAVHSVSLS